MLTASNICVGNPDGRFVDMANSREGSFCQQAMKLFPSWTVVVVLQLAVFLIPQPSGIANVNYWS